MNTRVETLRGWRAHHWQEQALAGLRFVAAAVARAYDRSQQRRQLARLDDRMLRDIGLSRIDAQQEARKPFWRA